MPSVLFCFDYELDLERAKKVRDTWLRYRFASAVPFYSNEDLDQFRCRRGNNFLQTERWRAFSVFVMLYGKNTSQSRRALAEAQRAIDLRKLIISIDISKIEDANQEVSASGLNPLALLKVIKFGGLRPADSIYPNYNWVLQNGDENIETWITREVRATGMWCP